MERWKRMEAAPAARHAPTPRLDMPDSSNCPLRQTSRLFLIKPRAFPLAKPLPGARLAKDDKDNKDNKDMRVFVLECPSLKSLESLESLEPQQLCPPGQNRFAKTKK